MSIVVANNSIELERYARLLAEAETIHGTSLWADAWRRLKKNRVAFGCLWFLMGISCLAFLTPLLPLQSPYETHTADYYAPPTIWPLMIENLSVPAQPTAGGSPCRFAWNGYRVSAPWEKIRALVYFVMCWVTVNVP